MKKDLVALSNAVNLEENLEFLGFVDDFERLLREIKCLVMPSESEGLSIALLCAMACGVVPIIRNVGDLIEAVHHYETGIVIKKATPDDIAFHLVELWSDNAMWNRLSHNAIKYVQTNCSLEGSSQRWDQYFEGWL